MKRTKQIIVAVCLYIFLLVVADFTLAVIKQRTSTTKCLESGGTMHKTDQGRPYCLRYKQFN